MASVASEWEDFPSYSDLYRCIRDFIEKAYREAYSKEKEIYLVESSRENDNFSVNDLLLVILFSITWTILRHLATEWIFKPLGHHYGLTPTNQAKLPESAWKFTYLLCAWIYTLYVVVLSDNYKFFRKPSTAWDNWNLKESPPTDIYMAAVAQCGFYFHALYATLFLDTWRKDSIVILLHHSLVVTAVYVFYSLRCLDIGYLVFFTHDICEVLLEFAKINVYFKIQKGKVVRMHEILSNITCFCLTVAWVVCRLYWFPMRVLYVLASEVQRFKLVLPRFLLMNSLLWIFLLFDLYWFLLILHFLYRLATGQIKEVDDIREYDVEKKLLCAKNHSRGSPVLNENVKTDGICDGGLTTNEAAAHASSRRAKEE